MRIGTDIELPKKLDFTFSNLHYSVKSKHGQKSILKGISGIC